MKRQHKLCQQRIVIAVKYIIAAHHVSRFNNDIFFSNFPFEIIMRSHFRSKKFICGDHIRRYNRIYFCQLLFTNHFNNFNQFFIELIFVRKTFGCIKCSIGCIRSSSSISSSSRIISSIASSASSSIISSSRSTTLCSIFSRQPFICPYIPPLIPTN